MKVGLVKKVVEVRKFLEVPDMFGYTLMRIWTENSGEDFRIEIEGNDEETERVIVPAREFIDACEELLAFDSTKTEAEVTDSPEGSPPCQK